MLTVPRCSGYLVCSFKGITGNEFVHLYSRFQVLRNTHLSCQNGKSFAVVHLSTNGFRRSLKSTLVLNFIPSLCALPYTRVRQSKQKRELINKTVQQKNCNVLLIMR